jgi:hypothetical protein
MYSKCFLIANNGINKKKNILLSDYEWHCYELLRNAGITNSVFSLSSAEVLRAKFNNPMIMMIIIMIDDGGGDIYVATLLGFWRVQ